MNVGDIKHFSKVEAVQAQDTLRGAILNAMQ
jgi:hypothetical protein